MRITRQLEDLRLERGPVVMAVGSFDGVHLGHQALIRGAADKAAAAGGSAWALTLDPHPMKVLKPEAAPLLITSTEHKLSLIEPLGADGCVVMPFTAELAAEEPAAFIDRLKASVPKLSELVMGPNWTFGHRGRGNAALARKLAPAHGFAVTVIPPVAWGGAPISSTRVRQAVSRGELDDAREMLGRPFSILGTVVPGKHVGTQLGFPTANLDPHNEVRPPGGVYAVRADVGGHRLNGAAFLAEASQAQSTPSGMVLEVHLFDFEDNVYGRDIEVFFERFVREARRFETRAALRKQIAADVEQIREMLG